MSRPAASGPIWKYILSLFKHKMYGLYFVTYNTTIYIPVTTILIFQTAGPPKLENRPNLSWTQYL